MGLGWGKLYVTIERRPVKRHSITSTGDSICILALGSGERLLYPSNRVRTVNPVSVRARVMVSASFSSAAVESPVLTESPVKIADRRKFRNWEGFLERLLTGYFYGSRCRYLVHMGLCILLMHCIWLNKQRLFVNAHSPAWNPR